MVSCGWLWLCAVLCALSTFTYTCTTVVQHLYLVEELGAADGDPQGDEDDEAVGGPVGRNLEWKSWTEAQTGGVTRKESMGRTWL